MSFAKEELTGYDVSKVCELLGVSRSSFYKARRQADHEEKELEQAVIHSFHRNHARYGRIRISKTPSTTLYLR